MIHARVDWKSEPGGTGKKPIYPSPWLPVVTLIDVNERERKVKIKNYTDKIMFRAFGVMEEPDYNQYIEFLESRCFPESRDKMKLILKDLALPFYDPIMIIEKTEGRMAEDDFWIRIER